MLNTIFATKIGMSQAWSTTGKRLPITKLLVDDNCVLNVKQDQNQVFKAELAYGKKKLKNVAKPLREQISKSGFSSGFKQIRSIEVDDRVKSGETIAIDQVLELGDVVAIQGQSKGRGLRRSQALQFSWWSTYHGQSDRQRAPGSIGATTSPGRVWKGQRMAGHFGTDTKTVLGLVVVHIDLANHEVWVNGPVPGHKNSIVKIKKTGAKKDIKLNEAVFGKKEETKKEETVTLKEETPTPAPEIQVNETGEAKKKEVKEEKTA